MTDKTDVELVGLAREGDKNAFGLLIERYRPLVLRLAMRSVADSDCAQDLVQETMLQAYLSLGNLHNPSLFKSWLCGIAANVCRHYLRDQKTIFFSREAMAGGLRFEAIQFTGISISPEQSAEEHELHRIIMESIQELEPADREATLLFYYDQMSLREIGAVLGISAGAVKVRLHRARGRLKARLLSDHPEIVPVEKRRKTMVRVTIADVVKKEYKNEQGGSHTMYALILHDEAGHRALPIWVGAFEGQSIAMGLSEFKTPRPLTFEFIVGILKSIDANLEEVRIESLKEDTFYAVVKIRYGKTSAEMDARPSDAIALAIRTGSPIFASEEVMKLAGIDIPRTVKKLPSRHGVENILKELGELQKHYKAPSLSEEEKTKIKEEGDKMLASVFGE